MKLLIKHLILAALVILSPGCHSNKGKHLFILAGQSNMVRLDPNLSFAPTVKKTYGEDQVIIVKDAMGAQPIRRWHKNWQPPEGVELVAQPDLYDSLMIKVNEAVSRKKLASVTFIWMQGERDAREELANVYATSLQGLYDQVSEDLGRKDVNFIIGRLSDFDLENEIYPQWTRIREIQVEVAESNPRFAWIDTDDLNDGINARGDTITNDLHMSEQGYETMGQRFAEAAILLIKQNK